MELRKKLFLVLAGMATVPLLVLLFGVVDRAERALEARVEAELQETLEKMERELRSLMDTQKALARGLAQVPALEAFAAIATPRHLDRARYEARRRALESFLLNYQTTVPSIQAIRFTDASGKTLVKVKEGHPVPAARVDALGRRYVEDIAYKPFFQRALASGDEVSVSDFERGKVAGEVEFCPAMVRYSVPVRGGDGELLGLLIVNMWGRRVDDVVVAALGGYPGHVYLVEANDEDPARDGIYLYHRDADKRFANQLGTPYRFPADAGEGVWERVRGGPQAGTVVTGDGRMYFYRRYEPYRDRLSQWVLVIESDRATVLAPVAGLRAWIWGLVAVVLMLSLLVARVAAARLARPVHELAAIITRYEKGDKSARYRERARDEIGAAGRAFNALADSLERAERERAAAERAARRAERLAAIGEMAAGIGHEINNPLMNIMSLARLIESSVGDADPEVKEDLELLQAEGRRCARIVQGILNFAREAEPEYREFDLAELVAESVDLLRHRLEAGGLRVRTRLERPLLMEGDPGQIQQVLVNVLLNAIHASPVGGEIEVRTRRDGGEAVVEVLDRGVGLAPGARDRVFDPFFTTKPVGQGTGLGLSVSYGIVKRHGGEIDLGDREGGGARAVVRLPLRREEPAAELPEEGLRRAG